MTGGWKDRESNESAQPFVTLGPATTRCVLELNKAPIQSGCMPLGPIAAAIKDKFQFEAPDAFNALEARNAFSWDPARREELIKLFNVSGPHYLFLFTCEWFQPDEIRDFEFPEFVEPLPPVSQFVPFAHDGCGNEWCWWTEKVTERGVPVVLCAHDSYDGEQHAPDFASFLFEKTVLHAVVISSNAEPDKVEECRETLRRFVSDLAFLWPDDWTETLHEIAQAPMKTWLWGGLSETGLLNDDDFQRIMAAKLNYRSFGKSFRWIVR